MLAGRTLFLFPALSLLFVTSESGKEQHQLFSQAPSSAAKCQWVGSSKSIHDRGGGIRTETLVGKLRFEYVSHFGGVPFYGLVGDEATWSASGTVGDCTLNGGPLTVSVGRDTLASGYLSIQDDGRYDGGASIDAPFNPEIIVTCPNGSFPLPGSWNILFSVSLDRNYFLSDSGMTMAGAYQLNDSQGGFMRYEWNLSFVGGEEEELIVELEQYESWLPEAGMDETTPGNWITMRAHLQHRDGSNPCRRATKFRFELVEASQEPGICLNYPEESKAKDDFDLQFIEFFHPSPDVLGPKGQWIETKGEAGKEGIEAEAIVSAFDWGAWGKLKVTAYLPGGREIVGHLKGDPNRTEILLPKREEDSFIADKWKEDNDVTALADDNDEEEQPKGDLDSFGHTGDGLTLYEEYRGFRENSRHIFGDPKQKDFFIYNQLGASATNGIKLFEALTKLNVRHQFQVDEFDTTNRVINFNYLDAPHQDFEQHGIWIKKVNPDSIDASRAEGGPGTPKKIKSVQIAVEPDKWRDLRRTGAKILTDEFASTVAHELGHCTNIFHHGTKDGDRTWRYKRNSSDTTQYARDANGRLIVVENGTQEIDVRLEDDIPYVPFVLKKYYIALQLGMHSGYEDCIMRYDVAKAYIPDAAGISPIRYWIQDGELVGIELCDQKVGTGVNLPSRSPRPRYGNAQRGECQKQICVNDLYH